MEYEWQSVKFNPPPKAERLIVSWDDGYMCFAQIVKKGPWESWTNCETGQDINLPIYWMVAPTPPHRIKPLMVLGRD